MDCKHKPKKIFLRTCVMMQQPYIQISRAERKKEKRIEEKSAMLDVTTTPTTTQKTTLLVAYIHTSIHAYTHYWLLLTATNCTED
jgi:hypothetical protein